MEPSLTALIKREDDMYVSICPELDIASQGYTIEEARDNLGEAVSLFLKTATFDEIKARYKDVIYVSELTYKSLSN